MLHLKQSMCQRLPAEMKYYVSVHSQGGIRGELCHRRRPVKGAHWPPQPSNVDLTTYLIQMLFLPRESIVSVSFSFVSYKRLACAAKVAATGASHLSTPFAGVNRLVHIHGRVRIRAWRLHLADLSKSSGSR